VGHHPSISPMAVRRRRASLGFGDAREVQSFLICPAFEETRAREIIGGTPIGKEADIRTSQEDESPTNC
jgi:hypothetical protein